MQAEVVVRVRGSDRMTKEPSGKRMLATTPSEVKEIQQNGAEDCRISVLIQLIQLRYSTAMVDQGVRERCVS